MTDTSLEDAETFTAKGIRRKISSSTYELQNSNVKITDYNEKQQTCILKTAKALLKQNLPYHIYRSMLNEVNYWIFNIGDRNKVYRCNYIHLLIALAITIKLLQIQMISSKNTYIKIFLNALIKKINQKQQLLLQISDKKYREDMFNSFMKLILNNNVKQKDLLKFLRSFLVDNKEIMMSFMPYYYNFFALVVNKQDVFMQEKPSQSLLQYTIDFQHDKFYNKDFKRTDIGQMIKMFEDKLIQKYNCIQA